MSDCFHIKGWLAALLLLPALPLQAGEPELVDPTRPSYLQAPQRKATAPRTPSWQVESIIVSPGRRLAMINGQFVAVGDRVAGARVVEILPYEVRLEYQGETRRVSLDTTRVKSPAN